MKQSFLSLQGCFFSAFFYFLPLAFGSGDLPCFFCPLGRHGEGEATGCRSSKSQPEHFLRFYFDKCTFAACMADTLAALKCLAYGMSARLNPLFLYSSKHVIVLYAVLG